LERPWDQVTHLFRVIQVSLEQVCSSAHGLDFILQALRLGLRVTEMDSHVTTGTRHGQGKLTPNSQSSAGDEHQFII
jgi:hypothetical protein